MYEFNDKLIKDYVNLDKLIENFEDSLNKITMDKVIMLIFANLKNNVYKISYSKFYELLESLQKKFPHIFSFDVPIERVMDRFILSGIITWDSPSFDTIRINMHLKEDINKSLEKWKWYSDVKENIMQATQYMDILLEDQSPPIKI